LLVCAAAPGLWRALGAGGAAEVPRLSCADLEVGEVALGDRSIAACAGDRSAAERLGCPYVRPVLAGERLVLREGESDRDDCTARFGPLAGAQLLMLGRRIDLNRASTADLADLPGVGEGLARRIARERETAGPFRSVEDLARVRGVGPGRIQALAEAAEVR
jgi:competence ComEA-like helix-hairpin-helix protein